MAQQILNILFVDDDDVTRAGAELFLHDVSKNAYFASNALDALELLKRKKIDLLISDIEMPEMNGVALCKAAKELNPKQTIIVISSSADTKNVIELINIGVDHFIAKPIHYTRLIDLIEHYESETVLAGKVAAFQEELKSKNEELTQTLEDLKQTQKQLVESEKMASLGSLVAGMAHELNTPAGIVLTSITFLETEIESLGAAFEGGSMKKRELAEFFSRGSDICRSIRIAAEKTSSLVSSFKLVSAESFNDKPSKFLLFEPIEYARLVYKELTCQRNIQFENLVDKDVKVVGYPDIISTIIENLLTNAVEHAFQERQNGKIAVSSVISGDMITLYFADDGVGVEESHVKKLTEPFYTTARGRGKSGLGLSIVYNLVKHKLSGEINFLTPESGGLTVVISFKSRSA